MAVRVPGGGAGETRVDVTAVTGSRYTDTAATNGAVHWAKASGSGSTGWKVVYGDTGWRRLTPSAAFVVAASAPQFDIKRVGTRVRFGARLSPAAAGASRASLFTILDTIPTGFVPRTGQNILLGIASRNAGGIVGGINNYVSRTRLDMQVGSDTGTQATGDIYGVGGEWDTDDAWPAALPGTAD